MPSDLASRGLWTELAELCALLRVKPKLVTLNEDEYGLLASVVAAAATRNGRVFEVDELRRGAVNNAPAEMESRLPTRAQASVTPTARGETPDPRVTQRRRRVDTTSAPMVANKRVRASSRHPTSVHLGCAADSVSQQDFSMADMVEACAIEATELLCVICLGGDEEGRVLVAKCCAQPLHAACFRQHVAARAYQDPNSDEETATLTRTRVKCPACNVALRSTSTKRVLREVESDVVVNAVVAPPDPPPSPPTDGQTWLDYARRGGQLRDWSAAVALTALAADDRATLPIVISIEAAVGAGKSTLLKLLRMLLQSPTVLFVPEPVDTWRETGMLRRYYAGEMSALEFQQRRSRRSTRHSRARSTRQTSRS